MRKFVLLTILTLLLTSLSVSGDSSLNLYLSEGESRRVNIEGKINLFTLEFVRGDLAGVSIDDEETVVFNLHKTQKIVLSDRTILSITLSRIDLTRTGKKAYFEIQSRTPEGPSSVIPYNLDFQRDTPPSTIDLVMGETKYIYIGPFKYRLYFEHADQRYGIFEMRDVIDLEGFRKVFGELEPIKFILNGDTIWVRPLEIRPTQYSYRAKLWIDSEEHFVREEVNENPYIPDTGVRYLDENRVRQILSHQEDQELLLEDQEELESEVVYEVENGVAAENFNLDDYREVDEEDKTELVEDTSRLSLITGAAVDSELDSCGGCLFSNRCYTIGTRTNYKGKSIFCGVDGSMYDQHSDGALCENNFECSSNQCRSGYCTNKASFWSRFFSFFGW